MLGQHLIESGLCKANLPIILKEQDLVQKYIINPKKGDAKYNRKEKSSMDSGTFKLLLLLILVVGFTAGVAYGIFNMDFDTVSQANSIAVVQDTAFLELNQTSTPTTSTATSYTNYSSSDSSYTPTSSSVETTSYSSSNSNSYDSGSDSSSSSSSSQDSGSSDQGSSSTDSGGGSNQQSGGNGN